MIDPDTGWYVMPVSLKAVVFDDEGRVLLARNPRNEWELPGGRPDATDATPQETVAREVHEESGIDINVRQIVDCWIYPVPGEGKVLIVTYLCDPIQNPTLILSDEHADLRFTPLRDIRTLSIPSGYMKSVQKAVELVEKSGEQR